MSLNYLVSNAFSPRAGGTASAQTLARQRGAPRPAPPAYLTPAKRRRAEKPVAKWRLEALRAATGARQQAWESDEAFARRLALEQRAARRHMQRQARAPNDFGAVARALLVEGSAGRGQGPAATLDTVQPLADTHLDFIGVYVLQSIAIPSRVYIGFTVDPERRLRQHNGELEGGARATGHGRPWRMVLHVSGFAAKVSALQFEWSLTHHTRSTHARAVLDLPVMRGAKRSAIALKARLAQLLMYTPKFCEMPLRVTWLCETTRAAHEIEFGDGDAGEQHDSTDADADAFYTSDPDIGVGGATHDVTYAHTTIGNSSGAASSINGINYYSAVNAAPASHTQPMIEIE